MEYFFCYVAGRAQPMRSIAVTEMYLKQQLLRCWEACLCWRLPVLLP